MAQKVTQVYMAVLMQSDMAKAVEFYKKLGLELLFQLEGKWAEFALGQVKIGLSPAPEVQKGTYTGLILQTPDLKKLAEELKADGVEFIAGPEVATHGVMASFLDPSGNRLDLYEPTHEKVREVLEKEGKLCRKSDEVCGDKSKDSGCCKK